MVDPGPRSILTSIYQRRDDFPRILAQQPAAGIDEL
jgi:hypothetical protein